MMSRPSRREKSAQLAPASQNTVANSPVSITLMGRIAIETFCKIKIKDINFTLSRRPLTHRGDKDTATSNGGAVKWRPRRDRGLGKTQLGRMKRREGGEEILRVWGWVW